MYKQYTEHWISAFIREKFTIKYSLIKLKPRICKALLVELSTYSQVPYANFEASVKPFLTSMKAGEFDTTQPSSVVTPIFVKTIILLFPHE